jgi:hypothetical protein
VGTVFEPRHVRDLGYALCVITSCLIYGCSQPEATAVVAEASAPASSTLSDKTRIIVKFVQGVTQPSSEKFVRGLSEDAGVKLAYGRAMGGDNVHVFLLEGVSSMKQLQEVISRLSTRRDVIYVEQDRRLRHQRSK